MDRQNILQLKLIENGLLKTNHMELLTFFKNYKIKNYSTYKSNNE